jgi:NAD dependent epimerase/dehydratase family enzyme
MARHHLVTESVLEDLEEILQRSEVDLKQLVDQNVVITGASGFIGTWLTLSWVTAHKKLSGSGSLLLTSRNPNAIQEMANIIADITSASIEQSTGISQAGQAISSMDDVTQQNAALVEQIAASSESLEQQAKNLATELAYFKTGNTTNTNYLVPKSASKPKSTQVKSSAIMTKASAAKVSDKEAVSFVGDDWEEF